MSAQQPQESVTIDVAQPPNDGQQTREPPINSRFVSVVNRYKETLLDRPIRYDVLSIIFTIFVFIGGLVGYLTSASVVSLVSGTIFAILLATGTYFEGAHRNPYPLLITLFGLAGLMLYRFVQTFKFMPAGFIGLVTSIMIARHCFLIYQKRQSSSSSAAAAAAADPAQQPAASAEQPLADQQNSSG